MWQVLRPESLIPLARSPDMLVRLAPHMPEEHRSAEQLALLLQSPQLRRQLDHFHAALVSGQLDLRHFGLDAEARTPPPPPPSPSSCILHQLMMGDKESITGLKRPLWCMKKLQCAPLICAAVLLIVMA